MFAIAAAVICGKARVPAGAAVFSVIAAVMFISTPAGSGLPGAVTSFLSTVDEAATPALSGHDRGARR